MTAPSAADLVEQAERVAETDPSVAIVLVEQVLAWRGPEEIGPYWRGRASWARGRAERHLGRYRDAQASLEVAVALLQRTGDREATARATVHLALERIDAGRFDEAIELIDQAAADLTGAEAARASAQRALALQRGGRIVDAKEDWERAMNAFLVAGMEVVAANCQESRGLVHAYRGELVMADADLEAAEKTFVRAGEHIRAAEAVHNRGFVAARRGDLPKALALFDQAQSRLAELGALRPAMLVDRVEVCLQAGLATEARGIAEAAVVSLDQVGLGADVPEACLLAARACEQDNDTSAAASWATRATALFAAQKRPRWELLARFASARAEATAGPPSVPLARRLMSIAQELADAGWAAQAVEANVKAVDVLVDAARPDEARKVLGHLLPALRRALPLGRLEVRLCQARLLLATGDGAEAERALNAALRALSAYQATLGSIELRTAGGGQARQLMALGIQAARSRGSCARALWWMEAVRTAQSGGVGAERDPEMDVALGSLRDVMVLQARDDMSPTEATVLRRRQAALEEVVRRLSRHAVGSSPSARPLGVAVLSRVLGAQLLIEYAAVGRALVAAVLYQGQCRLVELAGLSQVRQAVARLRLALQAVVRQPGAGAGALPSAAQDADDVLLKPLELPSAAEVVVVPDGIVASTPWGALRSLEGAAFVVATSASDFVRAGDVTLAGAPNPNVVVLVGPGLSHGEEEAAVVQKAWRGNANVLAGRRSALSAARDHIEEADIVHIAAHGSFRNGNPLLSSVRLWDGPVTGEELARATRNARLVVLSCCDTGILDSSGLGVSRLLNDEGTLAVVASVNPVSDVSAAPMMEAFHRAVASGASPASALRMARESVPGPDAVASASGFVCFGQGHHPVVEGARPKTEPSGSVTGPARSSYRP